MSCKAEAQHQTTEVFYVYRTIKVYGLGSQLCQKVSWNCWSVGIVRIWDSPCPASTTSWCSYEAETSWFCASYQASRTGWKPIVIRNVQRRVRQQTVGCNLFFGTCSGLGDASVCQFSDPGRCGEGTEATAQVKPKHMCSSF